jgi:hypothetical protein
LPRGSLPRIPRPLRLPGERRSRLAIELLAASCRAVGVGATQSEPVKAIDLGVGTRRAWWCRRDRSSAFVDCMGRVGERDDLADQRVARNYNLDLNRRPVPRTTVSPRTAAWLGSWCPPSGRACFVRVHPPHQPRWIPLDPRSQCQQPRCDQRTLARSGILRASRQIVSGTHGPPRCVLGDLHCRTRVAGLCR